MCAIAEKVVPRSIPTTLRVLMLKKVGRMPSFGAGWLVQFSGPRRGSICGSCGVLNRRSRSRSTEPLGDDFLRPNQFLAPDESALHPHDDSTVLFRKIRWLIVDHTMKGAIDPFPWLDFLDIKAMQDFDERMNGVFQIIPPLSDAAAFSFFLGRSGVLFAESVEMVVKINQVVDERLLERFVQKIVGILEQFGMK